MKIVLIIVGVIAAVSVVGTVVLVGFAPEGLMDFFKTEPHRTEVRTLIAADQELVETASAPGEIEPLTKVEISAEVAARIEQLPFREGDRIHRGDVIVKLDDRNLKASLQSAKAEREAERFRLQSEQASRTGALKHLAFSRRTLERQRKLHETGDISQSTLDEAQDRVHDLEAAAESSTHAISVIESRLAAADANIDRAEDALTKTVMISPIDGLLTRLNAEVGEVVMLGTMNNPGTVIMTIADLSRMILNARVAESDVAKIAVGQSAKVHINAYQDDVFEGVVRTIALQRTTELDGTGFFEVEIELDLQGRQIYSGLVANVDIEIASHRGVVVESQAVVERLVDELPSEVRGDPIINVRKKVTNVLYRVVDGKAACTPVRTGPSDLTHMLILEGLAEGDEVVVGPYKVLESIEHDELVKTEDADSDAEADPPQAVLATTANDGDSPPERTE